LSNVTLPEADAPVTVAEQVVELPTAIEPGEQLAVVVVLARATVSESVFELPWLFESPP
jgi:hypothetical protein